MNELMNVPTGWVFGASDVDNEPRGVLSFQKNGTFVKGSVLNCQSFLFFFEFGRFKLSPHRGLARPWP